VESDSVTRYFVTFKDGQGILQDIEVSEQLYSAFYEFKKHEKRQQNYFDRHIEHFDLTDAQINMRALRRSTDLEETVIDRMRNEALRQAIAELPEIQHRRFVLYYDHDLNYTKIGKLEGCSANSVKQSVDRAKGKIRKKLEEWI